MDGAGVKDIQGAMSENKLKREIERLRLDVEETRQIAAAREGVLKANLAEIERLYAELKGRVQDVRLKGYEIKVLNALNAIVATASRHMGLKELLPPTLKTLTDSIADIFSIQGKSVRVAGGIFLTEADGTLSLAALDGIRPEALGCGGKVSPGACVCGLTASTGDIISSQDCLKDPRHTLRNGTLPPAEHAHISLPLNSGGRLQGVAFLYIFPPGFVPAAADYTTLTSVGNYLGLQIERGRLYEEVERLATHDGLTGLYNRREFERYLGTEMSRAVRMAHPLSLIILDLDRFKSFNDLYGHQAGDDALRAVSSIIAKGVRGYDFAARYGGEEFAVVMPYTGLAKAVAVAERLRASVEAEPVKISGAEARITISAGVAAFPDDAETTPGIVKAADEALYHSKKDGRNRISVFSEIRPALKDAGEKA